jgi:hypothetical protein
MQYSSLLINVSGSYLDGNGGSVHLRIAVQFGTNAAETAELSLVFREIVIVLASRG